MGYLPNKYSCTFNVVIFLILESYKTRFERVLIYLLYGVIMRDKVGNLGRVICNARTNCTNITLFRKNKNNLTKNNLTKVTE